MIDAAHFTMLAAVGSAPASVAATATTASAAASETTGSLGSYLVTTVPSIVASILPQTFTTSTPVTVTSVNPPLSLEVSSAFIGGMSGALAGVRRKFDLVGVLVLAFVSGLGGGIIRDVLLQNYGIAAFQRQGLLFSALLGAIVGAFFYAAMTKVRPLFLVFDAVSLGLFAVVGADKALRAGQVFIPAILLGLITSVGGGVLRDILLDTTPNVLRPGQLYATAAFFGSLTFVGLATWLNVVKPWAAFLAVIVTFLLRVVGVWLGWRTAQPKDFSAPVGSLFKQVGAAFAQPVAPLGRLIHAGRVVDRVWPGGSKGRSETEDGSSGYGPPSTEAASAGGGNAAAAGSAASYVPDGLEDVFGEDTDADDGPPHGGDGPGDDPEENG